jgi:hypothetical protein
MKKLFLVAFIAATISCAQNDSISADYSDMIYSLDQTFAKTFEETLKSARTRADLEKLPSVADGYLRSNFYSGQFNFSTVRFSDNTFGRSADDVQPDLSFLTYAQRQFAEPFLQEVMLMEDLHPIPHALYIFELQVTNSSLSVVEKWQLFEISSLVRQGAQTIQTALDENAGSSRMKKIDIKNALRAGVIGLGVGAVGGAYAGATGGTVAFPVVGTVTGAVAGAVIGGAIGFVSGVAESILQDLLFG